MIDGDGFADGGGMNRRDGKTTEDYHITVRVRELAALLHFVVQLHSLVDVFPSHQPVYAVIPADDALHLLAGHATERQRFVDVITAKDMAHMVGKL